MEKHFPALTPASSPPLPEYSAEAKTPYVQIAHVLFMDIVGFGRFPMAAQGGVQIELQNIVQETKEVRQAQAHSAGLVAHPSGDGVLVHASRHAGTVGLIIRPTGDGMALVFFHDILCPLRCAIEITNILSTHGSDIKARTGGGQIKLRMGIHTGPVLMVEDLNGQADVAGDGIIYAQRVMDCGDAGHILLSEPVAKAIGKLDPWARWLTDLGTCRVKHGIPVHLWNLCGRTIGSPANFGNVGVPTKVFADTVARRETALSHESRTKRWEAEEGLRPYVRSLVMMLCTMGLIGCLTGGLCLWSPQTLRDLARYAGNSVSSGTRTVPPGTGSSTPSNPATSIREAGVPSGTHTTRFGENETNAAAKSTGGQVVPDLTGLTFPQAQAVGKKEHFRVKNSHTGGYDDEPAGRVCRQSKAVGSPFARGEVILVAISKGPLPEPGDTSASAPTASAPNPSAGAAEAASFQPAAPPALEPYTGIIINASHLSGLKRDQYAGIMDGTAQLYPDSDADHNEVLIHYCTGLADAKAKGGGSHPLILRAESLVSVNGVAHSVRLSEAQVKEWNAAAASLNLSETRKVAVIMPP